jgi:SHS2 domain-containing protein
MPYKILEHTADVRMFVEADSLEKLFSDAVYGMMDILKPRVGDKKKKVQRTIVLEAVDTTALLVDFLSEVLLCAHVHKEMYDEVIFESLSPHSLEATLRGLAASSFDEDIKAVTYHEAEVKETKDGNWETMIIFDI